MRTIYLMRHAKTELAGAKQSDADRALIDRGVRDAAAMGAHIKGLEAAPELVLCSTAVRTRQTLQHMGLTLPTELQSGLYLASVGEMVASIQDCDDAVSNLLVLGHNPGIHELVVWLLDEARHESNIQQLSVKYPTCTMATLQLDIAHWADIQPASALLTDLHIARG